MVEEGLNSNVSQYSSCILILPSDGLIMLEGDHIKVTASKYPFPTVCADTQSTDWFHSISRTLKWNERERQKAFVVVEEGRASESAEKLPAESTTLRHTPIADEKRKIDEHDGADAETESEDKYDIDYESDDRFAGSPPHPPVVSPRHVGVNAPIDRN